MKYLFYLSLAISLLCVCPNMTAQQNSSPITLMEESTTGKYKGTIESGGIVDLSSIIRIQVNRAEIEQRLFEMAGIPDSSDRLIKLREFNKVLSQETEIVRMLKELRSGQEISLATYAAWTSFQSNLLRNLRANNRPLFDEINGRIRAGEKEESGIETNAEFVIYVLHGKADTLRAELTREFGFNAENGDSSLLVYFRLGAFLKNRNGGRPIHVENFDTYEPGEFSEIKRFGAPPPVSKKENEEINRSVSLADQLNQDNQDMFKTFTQKLRKKAKELFSSKTAFDSLLATTKETLDSFKEAKKEGRIVTGLQTNVDKLNLVRDAYVFIANTFSQPLQPNMLESIPQSLSERLLDAFSEAKTQFEDISLATSPEGSDPLITEKLQLLSTQYKELESSVKQDLGKLQALFQDVTNLFGLFKRSYLKSEKFTDRVKRLRPGNIPEEGFIELNYIGQRSQGDQILVKATLEKGKDSNSAGFEQKEVFRQYISLMRVSPHIKMAGSLILANPYNRAGNTNIALKNSYQFAPSYGIFLKWGSRKSRFFNDFINLGIGMSFTSPDFNLDGTPEFGAGAVVTGLRDWVSAGWGWNFGADAPYTFIGFNIPFTVAGFSSPSSNVGNGF